MSFIRDAEIENTIRMMAAPVFRAAGLEPSAIKIFLVKDDSLNAFVGGGQNMFFHTGLLIRSKSANQLIGVIAHETGHISGGHISRTSDVVARSAVTSILGLVLGGAAIAATGSADLGTALMLGGQHVGQRSFFSFSQTQESTADQAALTMLDRTGQSAQGFFDFLKVVEGQELLISTKQEAYFRTHPLTQDRLTAIRAHIERSPYSDSETPSRIKAMHQRMRAKLQGFLNPLSQTLRIYPESDKSVPARYARSIAYYRRPDLDKALALIDGLIADMPKDPYFYEMKGQMLFENARPREALEAYNKALEFLPESSLIQTQVARIYLEMNDPKLLDKAIKHFKSALQSERRSAFVWQQLGIAYGRKGDVAQSSLALAEAGLLRGDVRAARFHVGKAEKMLPHGSPGWIQAQDIIQELDRQKQRRER